MNTVSDTPMDPQTTTTPPKGNGVVGWFLDNPFSGGAGDATLSPRVTCGHTPNATLGAVRGPAGAPEGGKVSEQQTHDPLAPAGLVRFLLSKAASDILAAAGNYFVLQACPSPHPEHGGRFILLALPVSKDVADACARVALGKAKAVRIKAKVDTLTTLTGGGVDNRNA